LPIDDVVVYRQEQDLSIKAMILSSIVLTLSMFVCSFAQERPDDSREEEQVPGGFYFPDWDPQSKHDYVGVFPVTRRTGYYVYRAGEPARLVGGITGTPFVFHSGPQYCGWIGLPGFGWFGCGLGPYPETMRAAPGVDSPSTTPTSVRLEEGMSQNRVLDAVGPPSRKVLLGLKEIWEYKGYSLLFESGTLKEIR
jgi:hypothetical protein